MTQDEYDELSNYAALEGSEVGSYVCEILCLRDSSESHGMTELFSNALDEELQHWLGRFRRECQIIEKTEAVPDRVFQALVWHEL